MDAERRIVLLSSLRESTTTPPIPVRQSRQINQRHHLHRVRRVTGLCCPRPRLTRLSASLSSLRLPSVRSIGRGTRCRTVGDRAAKTTKKPPRFAPMMPIVEITPAGNIHTQGGARVSLGNRLPHRFS